MATDFLLWNFYSGRWNEEVDTARKELKSTREGLDEIQANIHLLESSIAKDNVRLEKLLRAEQVSFGTTISMFLEAYHDRSIFICDTLLT